MIGKKNKQSRINQFLDDFANFTEQYYSGAVTQVIRHSEDDWIKIIIEGPQGSSLELWSKGAEVLVQFGESHWHIDSYDEPCNFENIYEDTIDIVLDVLRIKTSTYSCWRNGISIGGGSCAEVEEELVIHAARESFNGFDEIRFQVWANELKTIKV